MGIYKQIIAKITKGAVVDVKRKSEYCTIFKARKLITFINNDNRISKGDDDMFDVVFIS